jgi:hypothetical protein
MTESDTSCQQIDNYILLPFWNKYESLLMGLEWLAIPSKSSIFDFRSKDVKIITVLKRG